MLLRMRSVLAELVMPLCIHYHSMKIKLGAQTCRSRKRPVIALLGDFGRSITARVSASTKSQQLLFGELGAVLSSPEHNLGKESLLSLIDLLVIPGPNDPVVGSCSALPRARLLQHIVQPLLDNISAKTSGTLPKFMASPARFRYGQSEEILLHRDNTLQRLRQLSRRIDDKLNTHETIDAPVHLAKTLIDQCHLAPFAPAQSPKYWNHEHTLQLYPPPSILCLGDTTAPSFEVCYGKTTVFNPGNFARDGSFTLFRPNSGKIEMSVAP